LPPTFAELGVPADLVAVLDRRGITTPFPIQTATLPDTLAGRDISGRAPTGSGKTLAFGLPLVLNVTSARPGRPTGLVLVPTRELAEQVRRELAPLASATGRKVMAIYGGVGYGPQRSSLDRGADIVVACPGRLEDLVAQRAVNLADVQIAVVDEADRMADMGFLPAVKRLLDVTQADRQTMLFSATLDGAVDVLVRRYQHEPRRHEITDDEGEPGDVRHLFWKTDTTNRVALTADVVARHGSAIVFCRTKHGADRLVKQLGGAGVPAVAIHGNRSQPQRERALQQFSSGAARALVATDVAARGIHVDAVGCVVHFDPPADHKDYVHRSGRTGRAGVDGTVVSLVMHEQVRAARLLQRALGMAEGVEPADVELLGDRVPMKPMRPTEAPQPSSDRPRRSDGAGERSGRRGGEPRGGQGRGRPQGQSRRPHRGSGGQSKAPGARGGHARAR
jgi:superfamily II DNA/RNA helicase